MKIGDIVHPNALGSKSGSDLENVRVAILGAGKMADMHLKVLHKIKGVHIVGICNRSSDGARRLAEAYQIPRTFNDPLRMIDETFPDAVIVAVSHSSTVEIASLVLAKGIPCLIEKPAGFSSAETQKLASLADRNRCYNMVALNRRFYSVINQAYLAVLHCGPIKGILIESHERIQKMRDRLQFDSWIYDEWMTANTIHSIDLLRMLGGEIFSVHSKSRSVNESLGDNFVASIEFKSGILGTFVSHWNSEGGSSLKIFGSGVVAELAPLEKGFLNYSNGRRIKLHSDEADSMFKPGLFNQAITFLEDVAYKRKSSFPASDLQDNFKTMLLVEEIQNKNG